MLRSLGKLFKSDESPKEFITYGNIVLNETGCKVKIDNSDSIIDVPNESYSNNERVKVSIVNNHVTCSRLR